MPSLKLIAWQVGIALAVVLGVDHYKKLKG